MVRKFIFIQMILALLGSEMVNGQNRTVQIETVQKVSSLPENKYEKPFEELEKEIAKTAVYNKEKQLLKNQLKETELSFHYENVRMAFNKFGKNHFTYATYLEILADNLRYECNAESLEYYKEVIYIRQSLMSNFESTSSYTELLDKIASMYEHKNDFKNALMYYEKSLDKRKELLGDKHIDYFYALKNLADTYSKKYAYDKKQINFDLAEKYYIESMKGFEACMKNPYRYVGDENTGYVEFVYTNLPTQYILGAKHNISPIRLREITIVGLFELYNQHNMYDKAITYAKFIKKEERAYKEAIDYYYNVKKDYHTTIKYAKEGLKYARQAKDSFNIVQISIAIARAYAMMLDQKKSQLYSQEALEITEKLYKKNTPNYNKIFQQTERIKNYPENYITKKVINITSDSLLKVEKIHGKYSIENINTLEYLAKQYKEQNKSDSLEITYLKIHELRKTVFQKTPEQNIQTNREIFNFYRGTFSKNKIRDTILLAKMEYFLKENDSILINSLIINSPYVDIDDLTQTSLDFSDLYLLYKMYSKGFGYAESAYKTHLAFYENWHGKELDSLINLKFDIAKKNNNYKGKDSLLLRKKFENAIKYNENPYYRKAKSSLIEYCQELDKCDLLDTLLQSEQPINSIGLVRLGLTYGRYCCNTKTTEYLLKGTEGIRDSLKTTLKKNPKSSAITWLMLGRMKLAQIAIINGELQKASTYFWEILEGIPSVTRLQNPWIFPSINGRMRFPLPAKGDKLVISNLNTILDTLKATFWNEEECEKAHSMLHLAYCKHFQYTANGEVVSVQKELAKMLNSSKDKYLSSFFKNRNYYASFAYNAYNFELYTKQLLLYNEMQLWNTIRQSKDSTTIAILEEYKEKRALLGNEQNPKLEQRLQANLNELSNKLNTLSAPFRDRNKWWDINVDSIQSVLKPNDASIEFSSFFNEQDSLTYLIALVLTKQKKVEYIPLGTEAALRKLLARKNERNQDETEINTIYTDNQAALYAQLWQPIAEALKGQEISTIYYSPSGLLHQVAFAALVADKVPYKLHLVSSTRQLVDRVQTLSKPDTMFAFGRIKYNSPDEPQKEEIANTSIASKDGQSFFPFLSDDEVNSIKPIAGRNEVEYRLYTGYAANEGRFKTLATQAKSPAVLLISTHGFYLPYDKKNTDSTGAALMIQQPDPLRRSGLALAGANVYWRNGESVTKTENGILTADEIAQCNFKQTDLVVLSACETGLGDISGEGVFGLQRGFKQAGAKSILMSLWKVSNEETAEMMTLFFEQYLKDGDARAAFDLAQATMKKNYPDSPYIWASFVLLD